VERIPRIRRHHKLAMHDLRKLNVRTRLAAHFVTAHDHLPATAGAHISSGKDHAPGIVQLDLFAAYSAASGQL
jgi:predicted DNA-binding helix-hairpin-helix protein